MRYIYFVEGTPGVGKTTYVKEQIRENGLFAGGKLIYSGDVIPENMVRRQIKKGVMLSIEEARVIYRSRSYERYTREHLDKWIGICQKYRKSDQMLILDAGLFQAPMYELLGLYQLSPDQILAHIQKIIEIIEKHYYPRLLYLDSAEPVSCIQKAITAQQESRKDWVSGFCCWLEVAPYTLEQGYAGISGIEQFIADRYQIDKYLYSRLDIDKQCLFREVI